MIPLIILLFCLFNLLLSVFGLFSPSTAAKAAFKPPAWQLALSGMLVVVNIGLLWTGVRRGRWLEKARQAASNGSDPPVLSAH